MGRYVCGVCEYVYDEEKAGRTWEQLAEDWLCPVCESGKSQYRPAGVAVDGSELSGWTPRESTGLSDELMSDFDELEVHMADIHRMAETGEPIIEPMRTRRNAFG